MAILAILAVLGIGAFTSSQQKGRDSRRKAELRSIAAALELYFNDKGIYPADDGSGHIKGCYPDDMTVCSWGTVFQDKNQTVYMTSLPSDPQAAYTYMYFAGTGNASYQLYARLENTLDPDVPKSGTTPQVYSGLSCGLKLCNYGIASTNTTAATGRILINDQ